MWPGRKEGDGPKKAEKGKKGGKKGDRHQKKGDRGKKGDRHQKKGDRHQKRCRKKVAGTKKSYQRGKVLRELRCLLPFLFLVPVTLLFANIGVPAERCRELLLAIALRRLLPVILR
jgi:hypothetical protein